MAYCRVILLLFITVQCMGQHTGAKYLYYRSDHYSDTLIYESILDYYLTDSGGIKIQRYIPVQRYSFTKVVNDSPFVTKDSFYTDHRVMDQYRFIKKKKTILLQRYNDDTRKMRVEARYPFIRAGTADAPAPKRRFISDGLVVKNGYSACLGDTAIVVDHQPYKVYHLREYEGVSWTHPSTVKADIFLDINTLTLLRADIRYFDYSTGKPREYHRVTELNNTADTLHNFYADYEQDLILYQDTTKTWTPKQKETFLGRFSPQHSSYGECLLKHLDGKIPYHEYERNFYFRRLIFSKVCE